MWIVYRLRNKVNDKVYIGRLPMKYVNNEWLQNDAIFEKEIIGENYDRQTAVYIVRQLMILWQSFMPGKGYNVWEKDSI